MAITTQQSVDISINCDGTSKATAFNTTLPPLSTAPLVIGGVPIAPITIGTPTSVSASIEQQQIGEDPVNGAILDGVTVSSVTLLANVLTVNFNKPPLQTGSVVQDAFGNTFTIAPYRLTLNFTYNSLV